MPLCEHYSTLTLTLTLTRWQLRRATRCATRSPAVLPRKIAARCVPPPP